MADMISFPPDRALATCRERFEAEARKLMDRLDEIEEGKRNNGGWREILAGLSIGHQTEAERRERLDEMDRLEANRAKAMLFADRAEGQCGKPDDEGAA